MVLKVLLQNKSVTKAERKRALMIHWAVELIRKSCWKWSGVILIPHHLCVVLNTPLEKWETFRVFFSALHTVSAACYESGSP